MNSLDATTLVLLFLASLISMAIGFYIGYKRALKDIDRVSHE